MKLDARAKWDEWAWLRFPLLLLFMALLPVIDQASPINTSYLIGMSIGLVIGMLFGVEVSVKVNTGMPTSADELTRKELDAVALERKELIDAGIQMGKEIAELKARIHDLER